MLNETNRASGRDLQRMFEVIQIRLDPELVFQTSMTKHFLNQADSDNNDSANQIAVLLGGMTAYERALQALRDVRHLLPSDGVAIVDAVLDGAT